MQIKIILIGILLLLGTRPPAERLTGIRTAGETEAKGKDPDSLQGVYIRMNDLTLSDWRPLGNTYMKAVAGAGKGVVGRISQRYSVLTTSAPETEE
jgi:hypothetical protein